MLEINGQNKKNKSIDAFYFWGVSIDIVVAIELT